MERVATLECETKVKSSRRGRTNGTERNGEERRGEEDTAASQIEDEFAVGMRLMPRESCARDGRTAGSLRFGSLRFERSAASAARSSSICEPSLVSSQLDSSRFFNDMSSQQQSAALLAAAVCLKELADAHE